MRLTALPTAALALLSTIASPAATSLVDSIPALQAALDAAVPGDTITVKDGVYTTTQAITVRCPGTAEMPVTIAAQTVGGVEIAGTNGFDLVEPAAYTVVSGFKLTHASGHNSIGADTSHVRFTRNTFLCAGDLPYLTVTGDDAQVDHNDFGEKKTGNMISVTGSGSQIARRLWIHHNYFHDFADASANGNEMIRYGLLSAHGLSTGAGLVEYNLFARCHGVTESISNRSSGNTYRFNTFVDGANSRLELRAGNECQVYGNYFRDTEGMRIFGDRHLIFSNYFEGNYVAISLGNGDGELADGGPTSVHDRPDGCVIVFNTFVDNRTHYKMNKRSSKALGATNTTFSNNVLQGGEIAAKIDGPYPGAIWSNNLLWNVPDTANMPDSAFIKADPLLVADAAGTRRPQAGSPALGAALGSFPAVSVDLDGQPRPEKKSIGADEPDSAPATAKFLTPDDVGPAAK
ncbi:MAG TPA: polysaccharide lyase 6 family protein [Candidatus Didemnitutus sp.]|nr:polysaccharide lyase 6 family protein [Candidatus Didemnitutus sp.]